VFVKPGGPCARVFAYLVTHGRFKKSTQTKAVSQSFGASWAMIPPMPNAMSAMTQVKSIEIKHLPFQVHG
jgi:hypothetical protein